MEEFEEVNDRTLALTPAEYWEWRTTIAEMNIAKQKYISAQTELKVLQKETELLAIRSQLFQKTRVEAAKQEHESAAEEYERFKKVLEDRLGTTLNKKVIDDVTFEVRDLPEQITPSNDGKGH